MTAAGTTKLSRPIEILLVDDEPADVMLARECFAQTGYPLRLHDVENGEECLAYLRREGRYRDATTPDLILLDINMPKMNGHQVMDELLGDERLKHLPVVVFSTSQAPTDVAAMLARRCSSYIVKPIDLPGFQKVIDGLCDYWFKLPVLTVPA